MDIYTKVALRALILAALLLTVIKGSVAIRVVEIFLRL